MNTEDRTSKIRNQPSCRSQQRRWALRPLVVALATASLLSLPGLAVSPVRAQALPSGLNVVSGRASATVSGQQMTVTNSANSILNWQSFSIADQHGVYFAQPDSASKVLNRVVGSDPTSILGNLGSNGHVWLLNPNGVLFGQNARIDVGGLVTSTLRLNDLDWLNGRFNFAAAGSEPAAGIVNQGELRSSLGGRIALLGGSVRNEGLIDAPGGQVMLAAGHSIDLVDTGTPNLRLRVNAPEGEALNLGTLAAAGGRIDVHGAVVNQQGIVRADSLGINAAGEIELRATQTLDLAANSVTSASGAAGGMLMLDGGPAGRTLIHGEVLATGTAGPGGQMQLLGNEVGLLDAARIDVSGASGGGQVLVGGGAEGKDPSVRNAEGTYIGPNTWIRADATGIGDGGLIIIWGNQATRAHGSLSARGGSQGGDGGFIETSGGWIDANPALADASAAKGRAGTWLIDPAFDMIVSAFDGGGSVIEDPPGSGNFRSVGGPFAWMNSALILRAIDAGINVALSTGSCPNCPETGRIFFDRVTFNFAPPGPVTLTANADGNIDIFNSTFGSSTHPVGFGLTAGRGGRGGVTIRGSTIRTLGGDFDASGIMWSQTTPTGVAVERSLLDAGSGRVRFRGTGDIGRGLDQSGVRISQSSVSGRDIDIDGSSTASNSANSYGVDIGASTLTAREKMVINGTASHIGVFAGFGSKLEVRPVAPDPNASLTINGNSTWTDFGSSTFSSHEGVLLNDTEIFTTNLYVVGNHLPGGPPTEPSLKIDQARWFVDNAELTASQRMSLSTVEVVAEAMRLFADVVEINSGSTMRSSGTGDAIVIAGNGNPNTSLFINNAGPGALITPNGRWLIHGQDADHLQQGGLPYDFKQYDARFGEPNPLTPPTGNGLLFSDAPIVTISADPFVKPYDGTSAAGPFSGVGVSGQHDGDVLATGPTGLFDSRHVGTNRIIVLTPGSVTFNDSAGKPVLGYGVSGDLRGDIERKPVTLVGVSVANKAYDGNTNADVTATGLSGVVGTETLGTALSGNFDNKNVGNNKPVTVIVLLSDGSSGGMAGNYALAPVGTASADITARQLTGTFTAADKVYDGNDIASVSLIGLGNLVAGETLNATTTGNFDSKDAGVDKPVTVLVMLTDGSGGLAGNYQAPVGMTSADITRRTVTANVIGAVNKVYDGNTDAMVTISGLSGLVGGETLGTTASGSFDDKHVGTGKTVTVGTTLTDGTGLARNYQLAPAGTTTADISRRLLTGTFTAADKVYDGSTAANIATTLGNLVAGENLRTTTSGNFDTKDVGAAKPVTVLVVLADGAGGRASNYQAPAGGTTSADITPRPLNGSFNAADKIYDGNNTATVTLLGLGNLVGNETLNITTSGNFNNKDVGNDKPVTVLVVLADGSNGGLAGNYAAPATMPSPRAAITPATLTYNANLANKTEGAPLPPLSGSVSGFVAGESQASATSGSLVFVTPATATSPPGQYAIDGTGLNATNYNFVQAPGNATALSVTRASAGGTQGSTGGTVETEQGSRSALSRTLASVSPQRVFSSPAEGRVFDVIQTLRGNYLGQGALFRAIPVDEMSQDALTSLLAARDQYKKSLFGEAIRRLQQNPALADVPPCKTAQEVDNGSCLITEDLKNQLKAERAGVRQATAPAPATAAAAAAPAPAPAPTAATAAAPSTATTPASPAVVIPQAAPREGVGASFAIEPAPPLFTSRRVRSASLPQIERKVAVVIGINRYTDRRMPQLENAVGDAQAVGRILENQLGYETVVLENAGKAAVVRALNQLAIELEPKDSVVIYYAGHGELIESTGLGYWQLSDSNPTQPETWMSNADISRTIAKISADQVALISDSCYSGSLVEERIRARPGAVDPQQVLAKKSVVVMSSGGNEPVFDEGKNGHSPFAYNLMRNLEQVADWQVGGNLFERVRFAVARQLPQRPLYGAASTAGHQPGGDYLFEQRQLDK